MARLIYGNNVSLDGYVEDAGGHFDWSVPDPEVHRFINGLESEIGTYLYGRRLYEVMVAWEDPQIADGQESFVDDYAQLWRAAAKVVFSSRLETVSSARTRIEREFDPETIRRWKAEATRDLSVGGPDLAVAAIRAGLVDEIRMFVSPVIVGGGKRFLPDNVRLALELLDQRRFDNGVVYLHYRVTS